MTTRWVWLAAVSCLLAACTSTRAPSPVNPTATAVVSPSTLAVSTSTGPATTLTPTTGEPSAPTGEPSSTAAGDAVAAYVAFREAYAAALRRGALDGSTLEPYASGDALRDAQAALLRYEERGVVFRGSPLFDPRATDVGPLQVELRDCVDVSRWRPVFADSGASALAPGQPTRLSVGATVRQVDGVWKVDSMTTDRDATC